MTTLAAPILLNDPTSDLFTRPTTRRLFVAVTDCVLDDKGNAQDAKISFLEGYPSRVEWENWEVGRILHLRPFKLKLNKTPRTGLHVTSDYRSDDDELRYGTNFKIRQNGLFVLNPSNVVGLAEDLYSALASNEEAYLINRILNVVYGIRQFPRLQSYQHFETPNKQELK